VHQHRGQADVVEDEAVDAPGQQFGGAVVVVDGPGVDLEPGLMEAGDDLRREQGVADGGARRGREIAEATEQGVALTRLPDGVEHAHVRAGAGEAVEQGPVLRRDERTRHQRSVVVIERQDGVRGAWGGRFDVEEEVAAVVYLAEEGGELEFAHGKADVPLVIEDGECGQLTLVAEDEAAPGVPEIALDSVDAGGQRLLEVAEVVAGAVGDRIVAAAGARGRGVPPVDEVGVRRCRRR
jgi:hypothetical protein